MGHCGGGDGPNQFDALAALEQITGPAKRTIAWGTSMGGLVSALEAEDPRGQVDGVLTTCGLVGGALNINDYQLYGEYALSHLLAPGQPIKLVDYSSEAEAAAAGGALSAVVAGAQSTPEGRARIALGAALMNQPTWAPGTQATPPPPEPGPWDYAGQEAQQAQGLSGFTLGFVMFGRYSIELAAGGNSSGTVGVDFRALLASSSHEQQVRTLYEQAHLNLDADLATLARDAEIRPDPAAVASLSRTSMVTGRLRVPELAIHTTADHLIPVEHENWYAQQVDRAGAAGLLRQAYVHASGHCAFSPAETIAALHAVEHRLDTGRWDGVALPQQLNSAATALQLGGEGLRPGPQVAVGDGDVPDDRKALRVLGGPVAHELVEHAPFPISQVPILRLQGLGKERVGEGWSFGPCVHR